MPPPPEDLRDWADVFGALIGAFALGVAAFSIRKASRDLTEERKRIFELEILRDIGEHFPQLGPAQIRPLLMLLPGFDDMPRVRAAVGARPSRSYGNDLLRKYPFEGPAEQLSAYHMGCLVEDGVFRSELDDAISRRLK